MNQEAYSKLERLLKPSSWTASTEYFKNISDDLFLSQEVLQLCSPKTKYPCDTEFAWSETVSQASAYIAGPYAYELMPYTNPDEIKKHLSVNLFMLILAANKIKKSFNLSDNHPWENNLLDKASTLMSSDQQAILTQLRHDHQPQHVATAALALIAAKNGEASAAETLRGKLPKTLREELNQDKHRELSREILPSIPPNNNHRLLPSWPIDGVSRTACSFLGEKRTDSLNDSSDSQESAFQKNTENRENHTVKSGLSAAQCSFLGKRPRENTNEPTKTGKRQKIEHYTSKPTLAIAFP